MKTKLIFNITLLIITFYSYSQDKNDLDTKNSNSYAENGNFSIYSLKETETIENLKFIEYVKLDKLKFDFAKILIPKIVVIDTKQGDDGKKNQKRIEFLKKNKIIFENNAFKHSKQYEYSDIEGLQLSKSKFDFKNAEIILLGKLGNSKQKDILVSKNIKGNYDFKDNVISKFIGETSNKIYYVVDLGFYGIIEENEYNKSFSDKEIAYKEAEYNFENLEKEKLKILSYNWLNGNFLKIFPEEKIFLYDVSYLIKSDIKINSLAISNINPSSISKADFPENEQISLVNFNYNRDYNIFDLLNKGEVELDSIYVGGYRSSNDYSTWKKGESDNKMLDMEIDEIISNPKKFNFEYFLKKTKTLDLIAKDPLNLKFYLNNNEGSSFKIELLNDYTLQTSFTNEKLFFRISTPGYNGNPQSYGFKSEINREFDTRVDNINFNFTLPEFGFIYKFLDNINGNKTQPKKEILEEFIAKDYSDYIVGFSDYLKRENSKNKEIDKNKQLLVNKFGAKYTNEALNGNIIIGMPEGLLPIPLKLWKITSRSKWNNGYKLYCTSYLDSSAKLSVYVQNGKVTYVSF